MLIVNISSYSL